MINQRPPVRAADAGELLAAGTSLAVASAATDLFSDQIALANAAPELLCFEGASPEQMTRLRHASDELTHAVIAVLEAVQPQLVAGARERMALAVAEAEHVQARGREAAHRESEHPEPANYERFALNAKQRGRLKTIDASDKAWCPENGGQARMADVLAGRGLLTGPHFPGRVYEITEAGRAAARRGRCS